MKKVDSAVTDYLKHRKENFSVNVTVEYDDCYQWNEIILSYTYNGRQWSIALTVDEAESVIDALKKAIKKFAKERE